MDYTDNTFFISWIDPYAWFAVALATFVLSLIGASPLNYEHDEERKLRAHSAFLVHLRRVTLAAIPIFGFVMPLLAWFFYVSNRDLSLVETFSTFFSWYTSKSLYWLYPVLWWAVGFFVKTYMVRYWKPKLSDFKRKLRVNQTTESLSDIRDEKTRYAQKDFFPEDYYKPGYMVLGLNENGRAVEIPRSEWYETNAKIIGPTRKGKGVLLGCLIEQAILHGDVVFFFDDKGDEFIPHIMADRARKEGRSFFYCDLNDPDDEEDDNKNPGAWAPFIGGNLRSRRARILVAAGLNDTGNESDFYKQRERAILDKIFENAEGRIPLLLQEIEKNETYKENAQRLYNFLSEWVKVKSLCPKKNRGLSVEKCILNNAVVYVRGSLDDKIVRESVRIFVMEVVQEARRLKDKRQTHLSLFVDETRFVMSQSLADALATILNCRANIILAYQVKSDVKNLEDRTLDGRSIEHTVNTNCQITAIYGSSDPETNKWIEEMSGYRIKRVVQLEKTKVGALGEETWGDSRSISDEKEALITQNTMLTLNSRIAVLFRPAKLAEVVFTSFVPTTRENKFNKVNVVKSIKDISLGGTDLAVSE